MAVDMRNLEYVDEEAASKFECPLCISVLHDPVVVCKNEHHLCRSCFIMQRNGQKECPTCRSALQVREGQRFLKNRLEELVVRCPNWGCLETPMRSHVQAHQSTCPFSVIKCPHCATKMERRLFGDKSEHWHCDAVRFGCEFLGKSDSEVAVHLVDCAVFKCRARFEEYDRRLFALEQTAVPLGSMVAWAGRPDTLPKGWALCDGKEGRPDRQREFKQQVPRGSEKSRTKRSKRSTSSGDSSGVHIPRRRSRSGRRDGVVPIRDTHYSLAYIIRTAG